jgi:hypothetical protein
LRDDLVWLSELPHFEINILLKTKETNAVKPKWVLTYNSKPWNVLISSSSCQYLHSDNDLYILYIIKVHFLEDLREYDVHAHAYDRVSVHDGDDDANGHVNVHGHDHDHDGDDHDGGDGHGHDGDRVNDRDDVHANFPKEMTKPFLHQSHSKKLISYQKSFFQLTAAS